MTLPMVHFQLIPADIGKDTMVVDGMHYCVPCNKNQFCVTYSITGSTPSLRFGMFLTATERQYSKRELGRPLRAADLAAGCFRSWIRQATCSQDPFTSEPHDTKALRFLPESDPHLSAFLLQLPWQQAVPGRLHDAPAAQTRQI